jgi:hypothetical protein
MGERLKAFDYAQAVQNIKRFNEQHGMHREIPTPDGVLRPPLVELIQTLSAKR